MAKSWSDRLNAPGVPVVKPAPIDFAGMRAGQLMLVPTARMIDAFMRAIPARATIDVRTMRQQLAIANGAEITCAIYTGYHLRTVAEVALEALAAGMPIAAITPFWRVLDETSPTSGRLPCPPGFITARRAAEA